MIVPTIRVFELRFPPGAWLSASLALALGAWPAQAFAGEGPIGSTSQPLTTTPGATLWTTMNNVVPVCWETPGYDREKKISQEAVASTWQWFAHIDFIGWGDCPAGGDEKQVRIRISPQGEADLGASGVSRVGTAALSSAADDDPGVHLSFQAGKADVERVEYVAVHEFGHVLGFIHEQDAPGNEGPAACDSGVDPDADPDPLTPYDRDSVMNYCNRDGNRTGLLTDIDIQGVQKAYGERRKNVASLNSCDSAPLASMASLAAAWNDQQKTSVAVFPSDGTKFLYHQQWSVRDGGWDDSVKWVSGDFDDDGDTDIGAVWNNGGANTLTVRLSDGTSRFVPAHWSVDNGGWMDTTRWLGGDFNGDGVDDIAGAWNDGGNTSVAVFLSDRAQFLDHQHWSVRDGGWSDQVKWVSGDFDGDGVTDLGAAWNNDGVTTLTVRLSDGAGRFTPVHWSADAGRWWDAAIFVAGDFDDDGRADIAQLWNDIGRTSIDVSLSRGDRFAAPARWASRDGGWPGVVKWIPGDFDGDGDTDIGAVWEYYGQNTLTVRVSNGAGAFTPAHWSIDNGGWIPTTAWCSGTFH